MAPRQFEVRDARFKEKFMVDDAYLNGYAKLCGWKATLVYLSLCRHADIRQESFPSVEYMADRLGISTDSVSRAIKTLVLHRIVAVERRKDQTGKWLRNVYTLLDKKVWTSFPHRPQRPGNHTAGTGKNHTAVSGIKETHKKETQRDAATRRLVDNRSLSESELERLNLGILPR